MLVLQSDDVRVSVGVLLRLIIFLRGLLLGNLPLPGETPRERLGACDLRYDGIGNGDVSQVTVN